ncbi:hypothetical protein SCHPADRAFT_946051 [Schizopora paradoxa]|uniref:BAH domain-containing protein n=1 Tax=Schizopora paradoxa TaxID=27342 RepID=A0A0H2RNW8_9AGAM|nr:hypothetical protein SCHPADRAFT_946051 [Schizopora paradoxa]
MTQENQAIPNAFPTPRFEHWTERLEVVGELASFLIGTTAYRSRKKLEPIRVGRGRCTVRVTPPDYNAGSHYRPFLASVVHMRQSPDGQTVLAFVQWIHNKFSFRGDPLDIKADHNETLGDMEAVLTTLLEIVDTKRFQAAIPMQIFVDTDLDQPYVDSSKHYIRFTLNVESRSLVFPPGVKLCVCRCRYVPGSSSPMALCVRCDRWWHTDCLCLDRAKASRAFCREGTFQRTLRDRDERYEAEDFSSDAYDVLPGALVTLARSRILRGLPHHGIVGNALFVLKARSMVRDALVHDIPVSVDWEERLGLAPFRSPAVTVRDVHGEELALASRRAATTTTVCPAATAHFERPFPTPRKRQRSSQSQGTSVAIAGSSDRRSDLIVGIGSPSASLLMGARKKASALAFFRYQSRILGRIEYIPYARGFRVVRNGKTFPLLACFVPKKHGKLSRTERIGYLKWNRDGRISREGWRCKGCTALISKKTDYAAVEVYPLLVHELQCAGLQERRRREYAGDRIRDDNSDVSSTTSFDSYGDPEYPPLD